MEFNNKKNIYESNVESKLKTSRTCQSLDFTNLDMNQYKNSKVSTEIMNKVQVFENYIEESIIIYK